MGRLSVILAVAAVGMLAYGAYYLATTPDGAELFVRENCDKCHVLRGKGIGVIDLTGVTERRSPAWLRDQIVNPRLHDPHPGMPGFAHLSCREVGALIDHIEGK